MAINTLALFLLVAVAIGGVAYVFLYPLLSGEKRVEQRIDSVARAVRTPTKPAASAQIRNRREQVEETLKEIEGRRAKANNPPLSMRIAQAGLTWSKQQFMIVSGVLGAGAFLALLIVTGEFLPALGVGFGAAFGAPRWLLSHLKKRRDRAFMAAFPDAVDINVRGIKAGLPLLD
jgi:tight adherence protein B